MLQGINQGSAGILRLMYFDSIKTFVLKFNWPGNSTFRLFNSKNNPHPDWKILGTNVWLTTKFTFRKIHNKVKS